jgi:hypothetical protein
MSLSESPNQQALREFESTTCAICRKAKKARQSFCVRCYFNLPAEMKTDLYKRFGQGYEDAYHSAKDYLLGEKRAGG